LVAEKNNRLTTAESDAKIYFGIHQGIDALLMMEFSLPKCTPIFMQNTIYNIYVTLVLRSSMNDFKSKKNDRKRTSRGVVSGKGQIYILCFSNMLDIHGLVFFLSKPSVIL
jgi:hypothetical protein